LSVSFNTQKLHQQIERIRAGDTAAQEDLIRAIAARVERLVRKMLAQFATVRPWVETDDVLQNTLLRLLAALRSIRPSSTRDFFTLAGYLTRQELIDLTRRFSMRQAAVDAGARGSQEAQPLVLDSAAELHHLDVWRRFHQAIEDLPADVREVVSLTFYHGWRQAQIAEVQGVDVRTVRRRWAAGCLSLRDTLRDDLNELLH
jgi:RNA polymerase sigma factor (sigma-70 family)